MPDGDGGRKPITDERCRRELDESRVATDLGERVKVTGPVTDGSGGRKPATDERYRRVGLGENVVLCLSNVVHCPTGDAQSRVPNDTQLSVAELDPHRLEHKVLVILRRLEAPV